MACAHDGCTDTQNRFYGQCMICECLYMGNQHHSCSCGHDIANHVELSMCKEDSCHCNGFLSTGSISQCFTCLHEASFHAKEKTSDNEQETLKQWVLEGHKIMEILRMYQLKYNVKPSRRTLQRKLQSFGIKYTDDCTVSDQQVLEAVKKENALGVVGYRRLYTNLRSKYRLPISRDRLWSLIREEDLPKGIDPKLGKGKLHQKPFISKGPNYLWSVDGHEKLAQPFGLYIYGIIDTFSRKLLALHVLPDKKMETVSNWLLTEICHIGGKPNKIMVDKGTEWGHVKDLLDIVQMTSVFNQKIEAFWGQMLRHSDMQWYRSVLLQLEREGHFVRQDATDRWIVWRVFNELVQDSLNEYRRTHNSNKIRKQANLNLPSGHAPNVMWEQPALFDVENYMEPLEPVPAHPLNVVYADMEKHHLPDRLKVKVTKENCVELYIGIRSIVKQPPSSST